MLVKDVVRTRFVASCEATCSSVKHSIGYSDVVTSKHWCPPSRRQAGSWLLSLRRSLLLELHGIATAHTITAQVTIAESPAEHRRRINSCSRNQRPLGFQ